MSELSSVITENMIKYNTSEGEIDGCAFIPAFTQIASSPRQEMVKNLNLIKTLAGDSDNKGEIEKVIMIMQKSQQYNKFSLDQTRSLWSQQTWREVINETLKEHGVYLEQVLEIFNVQSPVLTVESSDTQKPSQVHAVYK